jgi:hypothetical protein
MASWLEERQAIESYFSTNWGTATLVKYENTNFIQPGTQNLTRQPWVAFFVRRVTGGRAAISSDNPLRRYVGMIIVQVFTDVGIGSSSAEGYAEQIADLFRDVAITVDASSTVQIGGHHDGGFNTEPHVETIGEDGHGWFQVNVTVRYRRDDR